MHYYVNNQTIITHLFISLNTKKSVVKKCTDGPKYFGTHCRTKQTQTKGQN